VFYGGIRINDHLGINNVLAHRLSVRDGAALVGRRIAMMCAIALRSPTGLLNRSSSTAAAGSPRSCPGRANPVSHSFGIPDSLQHAPARLAQPDKPIPARNQCFMYDPRYNSGLCLPTIGATARVEETPLKGDML
jgi:hypothetical protein